MAHDDFSDVFAVLEWIGKILASAMAGAYSAYKWFCGKFDAVEVKANAQFSTLQGQIDILDSDTVKRMGHMDARIQEHATRLAVGEKDFQNFRDQLDEVRDGQKELGKKQDQMLVLLGELRRAKP